MSYFLEDLLHFQRLNIFKLGRDKHRSDSHNMQVTNLDRIGAHPEETVQKTDSQEESLVVTLEISEHLDHPVDHPCSETLCDFVSIQEVSGLILSL